MTYTRKQLVTCVSIVILIAATALSGYASSRATRLSVPISNTLSAFTTALPIVAGLLLEAGYDLTRFQDSRRKRRDLLSSGESTPRPPLVIVANTLIFIYSTVVMTLLGTHAAPPSGLVCGLKDRWTQMYRNKDAQTIQAIQDTLSCCGLVTSRDMAWPFPDKTHTVHACEEVFGRTTSCLGPWRREEQRIAGLLMGVVGLVFVWQFAIIAIPTQSESWLHRVLPNTISDFVAAEEHGSRSGSRRAIDYLPNFSQYRDNAAEEVSDEEGEPQQNGQRTIGGSAGQASNGLLGANHERGQQQSTLENEWTRG